MLILKYLTGRKEAKLGKKYVRIQFEIPEEKYKAIEKLMETCGMRTKTELWNNALTLLEWAAEQIQKGCVVASIDEAGAKCREFWMPFLQFVKNRISAK